MCCASADPNEFAIWLTWTGLEPSLKSILLNSHMDVVPVIEPVGIPQKKLVSFQKYVSRIN